MDQPDDRSPILALNGTSQTVTVLTNHRDNAPPRILKGEETAGSLTIAGESTFHRLNLPNNESKSN